MDAGVVGRESRSYYPESVSSNLQQQLQMEKSQVQYVVEKLRQETKKVLGEWILLQYYLDELKVICEKEERVIRDLQTQEHQVEKSSWVRVRSIIIYTWTIRVSVHRQNCGFTYNLYTYKRTQTHTHTNTHTFHPLLS